MTKYTVQKCPSLVSGNFCISHKTSVRYCKECTDCMVKDCLAELALAIQREENAAVRNGFEDIAQKIKNICEVAIEEDEE